MTSAIVASYFGEAELKRELDRMAWHGEVVAIERLGHDPLYVEQCNCERTQAQEKD